MCVHIYWNNMLAYNPSLLVGHLTTATVTYNIWSCFSFITRVICGNLPQSIYTIYTCNHWTLQTALKVVR